MRPNAFPLHQVRTVLVNVATQATESPNQSKDKEANWLPAPKGPFWLAMRLYWPKDEATSGKWAAPPVKRVQ